MILIAGGEADPNLARLIERIHSKGDDYYSITVGSNNNPKVFWDLNSNTLYLDNQTIDISGAFLRYDVFNQLTDSRPANGFRAGAWYSTILGWLLTREDICILNRQYALQVTNKPYVLYLAKLSGLDIPDTAISNDMAKLEQLQAQQVRVAKPVNGGGYCQTVSELMATTQVKKKATAAPAIVQNTLVPPEIRIFGIKGVFFAFQVIADTLDYRVAKQCIVETVSLSSLPAELIHNLHQLMKILNMDFGAADFKACPETGKLLFLEINSSPMFARFDQVSDFMLTDAIIKTLNN